MARKHVPMQSEFPYHVTARCINREWFTIPVTDVWDVMSEQLAFVSHAFNFQILAFVLMNNHFHLIVKTPLANLCDGMGWFMRETSRSINRLGDRENQNYGGRYFRSLLGTNHYFLNAYKYLYYNPVKANLCESVLDYKFSTLPGLLGQSKLIFPVYYDQTLFSDVSGTLNWLDCAPRDENWDAVRRALRRKEFKLPKLNSRPHPLEIDTL